MVLCDEDELGTNSKTPDDAPASELLARRSDVVASQPALSLDLLMPSAWWPGPVHDATLMSVLSPRWCHHLPGEAWDTWGQATCPQPHVCELVRERDRSEDPTRVASCPPPATERIPQEKPPACEGVGVSSLVSGLDCGGMDVPRCRMSLRLGARRWWRVGTGPSLRSCPPPGGAG